MEELIALGARRLLSLGWAGSLQTAAPAGHLLIPTACIAEEGTAAHYLPGAAAAARLEAVVQLPPP